jgi:hypothetical protein
MTHLDHMHALNRAAYDAFRSAPKGSQQRADLLAIAHRTDALTDDAARDAATEAAVTQIMSEGAA